MNARNKEILNFDEIKEKLLRILENKDNAIMVMATSADNVVMARTILTINVGLDIYFFTWKYSRKCKQIKKNSHVSLCKDKIEIEGEAKILGSMTAKNNEKILEFIKNKYPDAVKRWEAKPGMIIIRIKPAFACVDGYFINNDAYVEYLDLNKKQAYRLKWASRR